VNDLDGLVDAATASLPAIVDVRRRIHRQPEIGLELPRTQQTIVAELEKRGLAPRVGTALGSVSATIEGGQPGPTILLRADMDALPLTERTELEFASEVPGAMHACGHDTHVAKLLGAVDLHLERRDALRGRVLLMFQPGEEGYAGAPMMLDEGLLDLPVDERFGPVTGAFAIHITNNWETRTIHLRPGAQMASSDVLRIDIHGRGGHASSPHAAVDPIVIAAEVILGLQAMVTRRIDVFDPAVVTIANVVAGTTDNIIPEGAHLLGTIRAVSEETREEVGRNVRRVAEGIAGAHGATADVNIKHGYPVTVNDGPFAEFVEDLAREIAGSGNVARMAAPIMGSEDFSYVLQRVPGAMAFLGGRPEGMDPDTAPRNHSDVVVFDEGAMPLGAALYAAVALRHADRATAG
jgi:hippurate hydrolase